MGLDFKEALKKLADRAGVEVEILRYREIRPKSRKRMSICAHLLEDAIIYYRTHLFNNKEVLTYLHEKRGLTDATIETFGLGYAPHGYDNLLKSFSAKGYSEQELIDAGMLSVREADTRHLDSLTSVFTTNSATAS